MPMFQVTKSYNVRRHETYTINANRLSEKQIDLIIEAGEAGGDPRVEAILRAHMPEIEYHDGCDDLDVVYVLDDSA